MTILHVKPSLKSQKYTHFVLCYGVEENSVSILDPPYSIRSIPFNKLAGLWDGQALVISDGPISKQSIFARERIYWSIVVGTILCVVVVIQISGGGCRILERSSSSWIYSMSLSFYQAMILGILVVLIAPLFHLLQGQGLLANGVVVRAVQKSHAGDFVQKVSLNSVERLVRDNVAFVDARFRRDFDAGHLQGAISVPVNATAEERRKALTGTTKNTKIVVYCQSAGCQFAKKVAVKLKDDGFSDVSIFKGGWREWSSRNRQEKESES
ncbi:MAG: rhodanese-like domain-containing protein, partial [Planctomycetota bacterium]|jgi:rhodanese-related sulfurtransferase